MFDDVGEREAAFGFALSGLPLLLPLFALEPFHGAAFAVEDGAVMVLGSTGAGKSTTAASLLRAGFTLLADDACALDDEGRLWPGAPLLASRRGDDELSSIARYTDKFVVELGRHDPSPHDPVGVVVLRPSGSGKLHVRQLEGGEALSAVLEQVRSPWALADMRGQRQVSSAARLASIGVGELTYVPGRDSPESVVEILIRWLGVAKL